MLLIFKFSESSIALVSQRVLNDDSGTGERKEAKETDRSMVGQRQAQVQPPIDN